jgi:hypothetical protein
VGQGLNSNFNVAANWANQASPAAVGDTAFFYPLIVGRNVVVLNSGTRLAGMAVQGSTFLGPYEFRGGGSTLTVDGSFGVNRGTSASMTNQASISAKLFYLQDTASLSLNYAQLFTIDSVIAGNLSLDASATFTALSTASVESGGKVTIAGGAVATSDEYFDVGRETAGTLEMSGAGSLLTAGGTFAASWGYVNGSATVTLANGATASYTAGLQLAKFGAAGTADVAIKSGATLDVGGPLTVTGNAPNDGSATIRVDAATLNARRSATFGNRSSLLLGSDSRASFLEGATFNAGSLLNIKDGAVLTVSPDKMLTFDGGTASIQSDVYYPSNATMFRVRGSGSVDAYGTFDLRTATLYVDGNGKLENLSTTQSSTWANSGGWVAQARIYGNGSVIYRNGLTICGTGGSATVVQDGGLFKTRSLTVGGGATSSAFLYLDGGKFEHDSVELRRGASMYQTGGTWSAVRQLTMRDNAYLNLAAGKGLSLKVQSLTLLDQARIELNDNQVVVDYTAASPLASLTQYVRNAYNNGNWLGNGLTSAVANLDPRMAVGLSDVGGIVTIRATLAGDADTDFRVNFNDLLVLAANYNQSGRAWQTGDFNYDGVVNFDDLLRLASNYNQSLTGTLGGDWALARASVPEPTAAVAFGVATTSLLMRRRRLAGRSR